MPPRSGATRREFLLPTGHRIVADTFGDPRAQPVVFLHGGGQTRHAWGGTAQALADAGYYAVSMDHRGHGESDWHRDGNYTIDGFVSDLLGVLRELGRPVVLIGASLGGITAMLAEAQSKPSVASALVMVDVTPRLEIPGVKRVIAFMAARPDGFVSLEEAADFVASYMQDRPRPKDNAGLEKNLRRGPDGRYRWHWDPKVMKEWNPENFDLEVSARMVRERMEAATHIQVPVLLVRGRMSDVVSEAGAREFLAAVPHVEYVDLQAAGHMVAGDRNDAFTSAVVEFVKRVVPA